MIDFTKRLSVHFRDQFCCRYCRNYIHPLSDELTLDHIDPNGGDEPENLATACRRCNGSKGKTSAEEFMRKMSGISTGVHEPFPVVPSLDHIIETISERNGIKVDRLLAGGNQWEYVRIRRQVAQAAIPHYSLSTIARALNRHHTSIMHYLKPVSQISTENR